MKIEARYFETLIISFKHLNEIVNVLGSILLSNDLIFRFDFGQCFNEVVWTIGVLTQILISRYHLLA